MKQINATTEPDVNATDPRPLSADEVALVAGGIAAPVGGGLLKIDVEWSTPELGHVLLTRDVMVIQDGVIMNKDALGLI